MNSIQKKAKEYLHYRYPTSTDPIFQAVLSAIDLYAGQGEMEWIKICRKLSPTKECLIIKTSTIKYSYTWNLKHKKLDMTMNFIIKL